MHNVLKRKIQQHVLIRLKENDSEKALHFIREQGWNYWKVTSHFGVLEVNESLSHRLLTKLENALGSRLNVCIKPKDKAVLRNQEDDFYENALLKSVLETAYQLQVSDIYLTVYSEKAQLKFKSKRDCIKHEIFSAATGENLLKSFLVLAKLNFDMTRRPREGHFRYEYKGKILFFRLSYMASSVAQSLVLRLLSEDLFPFSIDTLGLPEDLLYFIEHKLVGNGMILISGPTGSGKTTTLYALGKLLCQKGLKIISLEDPIEAEIDDWLQTEIDPKVNYTFESGLKAVLRQDPDVILIGEIRDDETAKAAFYACLSGYLVITTLHVQRIDQVAMRCFELGIDFTLFKDNIQLQIHQSWNFGSKSIYPDFDWTFGIKK